jgi:hypothetical protein
MRRQVMDEVARNDRFEEDKTVQLTWCGQYDWESHYERDLPNRLYLYLGEWCGFYSEDVCV